MVLAGSVKALVADWTQLGYFLQVDGSANQSGVILKDRHLDRR